MLKKNKKNKPIIQKKIALEIHRAKMRFRSISLFTVQKPDKSKQLSLQNE